MAADHTFYIVCSYGALAAALLLEVWALRRRRQAAIRQARHQRLGD